MKQSWMLVSQAGLWSTGAPVAVYARAMTRALSCSLFVLARLLCGARLSRVFPSLPPLPCGYLCIIGRVGLGLAVCLFLQCISTEPRASV